MTESRYRSNIGIIAFFILILFAASALSSDPAAGMTRATSGESPSAGSSYKAPNPGPDKPDPGRTAPGGFKVQQPVRGFDLDPQPIGRPGGLTTGGGQHGFFSNCFVDFNDDTVLSILPYQAIHAIVEWPFWNQYCSPPSDIAIAVEPIASGHFHMNYVDKDLRWCTDLGTFGRPHDPEDILSTCSNIDPLSEPREAVRPHIPGMALRVYAYNTDTRERVQFTMNQIRVLAGTSELCFVRTDLPWIAAGPTDQPAGYCGELGAGNWDISATVTDAYEVRIYSRSNNNTFTDIGLNTFS